MDGQELFLQKIHDLEDRASKEKRSLSRDEIREAFSGMDLTQEHMDFIIRYFESRQIGVEGVDRPELEDPSDAQVHTRESRSERDIVSLYMEEMRQAFTLTDREEKKLIGRLLEGDTQARDLLVEGYLAQAAEIAGAYRGQGLSHADLIQECNLGLLLAVSSYAPEDHGDFAPYVREAVCAHIEEQLKEYTHSLRSARKLARQMNRLNDTASAFAAEHGREARPDELADRMGIPESEVRDLMKASLDAIDFLVL